MRTFRSAMKAGLKACTTYEEHQCNAFICSHWRSLEY